MNLRERFCKVMACEQVTQVPNFELGAWAQTIDQWLLEGLPRDAVYLNWFEGEPYFGLDRRAYATLNIRMEPPFDYEVLAEDERYITARHPDGVVTKALKEGTSRGQRNCMDQYIGHPVTDRKSFQEIKKRYDPRSPIRYPLWWDEWVRIWKTRDYPLSLLHNGTFGLYSQLRSWVGTEEISYLFYDDPAFAEEMLEFNTEFLLAMVEPALQQLDFDFFNFFEDFAGKGGPLISPEIFRKFFMPCYKKIIERFNRAGISSIWLDSDGDPEALYPLMLEAGITCFWPLEQSSGMDPVRLRKKFGRHVTLAGGIDKLVLAQDTRAIEDELYRKIPPLLEIGGYLPFIDHTVQPDVPYENFLFYLELKKKLLG